MPFPVAAAIAAGGSLLSSGLSSLSNRRNTNKTIEANRKMAQFQYSKDLEMWNRTNEYNSPENQMLRLKQGGLNPNLVYGHGTVAGNAPQGSMPKFNAPQAQYNYSPLDVSSPISTFQDMTMKQAQTDNLRAQNDAIRQTVVGKTFSNRLFGDTYFDRVRSLVGSRELVEEKGAQARQQTEKTAGELGWLQEGNFPGGRSNQSKMMDTQLQFRQGMNRQQQTQIDKMINDTEFTKLKNEWYVTQMISRLGMEAVRTLGGFIPKLGNTPRHLTDKLPSATDLRKYNPNITRRLASRQAHK